MAKSRPARVTTSPPASVPEPAAYTVVARRYRPQQFAELIGQEHVAGRSSTHCSPAASPTPTSSPVLAAWGRRAPPASSRKHSTANAVRRRPPATSARVAWPSRRATTSTCWRSTARATAAWTRFAICGKGSDSGPARSRYKVYIIDEVHMLSTAAFNALLKTLEEPPEHVKFILATTEVQKIPDHDSLALPALRLRVCGTGENLRATQADRRNAKVCPPTTTPCGWSLAAPAVRCAIRNRCSISSSRPRPAN